MSIHSDTVHLYRIDFKFISNNVTKVKAAKAYVQNNSMSELWKQNSDALALLGLLMTIV